MSKLHDLIQELCPEGVEWKKLWNVTTWDKKFNSVDRSKQPQVINYPYLLAKELFQLEQYNGNVFLLSTGEQTGWTSEELAGNYLCEGEVVTIPWGKSRKVSEVMKYYKGKFVTADNRIATSNNTSILSNKFLYYWMLTQSDNIDKCYRGAGIQHPDMAQILELEIPIPPLEVQNEIVRILDTFTSHAAELQAELQARKEQYEYYRNKLLTFDENDEGVKWMKIKDVFDIKNGYTPSKSKQEYWNNGNIPWFRMEDIRQNGRILSDSIQHITKEGVKKGKLFPVNSFIIATTATIGEHALITVEYLANQRFTNLVVRDLLKDNIKIKYLYYYLFIIGKWCKNNTNVSGFESVDMTKFSKLQIPIPSLSEQQHIVSILDKFEALVNDLTAGLPAEIAAVQEQYEYYRNKLLTFNRIN